MCCFACADPLKAPFTGIFATGVSVEALTAADVELICLVQPTYQSPQGKLLRLKLDLPYFKQNGNYRYRLRDQGYTLKFDDLHDVLLMLPAGEYDGNPFYAPRAIYEIIRSASESSITFLGFRGYDKFRYAIVNKDEKYGNRGALVRGPFPSERYLLIAQDEKILSALTPEEEAENVDILYGFKPESDLVKRIISEKKQLQ